VWAVTLAQAVLMVLWKLLPRSHAGDIEKLVVYVMALAVVGQIAHLGLLPRTRAILPGEAMMAD
jgi:hypothetical protein